MNAVNRLWNRNFSILWQGQFISEFGNAVFAVALGFWVMKETGSAAQMGIVEACFAIPAVVLGPFTGAFADRHDRKRIIVTADLLRGVLFAAMGAAALFGVFPFAAVYPLAALAGCLGAFFTPAMSSSIPDIVPADSLSKANSARGFSSTVMQLAGSPLGGLLYVAIGAPLMFLANGVSFLYASATQLFMRIPARPAAPERKHILQDMAHGFTYVFGSRGLRTIVFTGSVINFFAAFGTILFVPLFDGKPGFGADRYGFVMGAMMAGMVAGTLLFSIVRIRPPQRSSVFGLSAMVMVCVMVPIGLVGDVTWLYPLAFMAGITNSTVNMLFQTVMQSTVAAEHRGKVFGILGTLMGGLSPIAMALSGITAEMLGKVFGKLHGIEITMTAAFCLLVLAVLPLLFDRPFKAFINTDATALQGASDAGASAAQDSPVPQPESAETPV